MFMVSQICGGFSKSSKHSDGAEPDEIADNGGDNADDNNEILFLVLKIFILDLLKGFPKNKKSSL